MFCASCKFQSDDNERFCRQCGSEFKPAAIASVAQNLPNTRSGEQTLSGFSSKDPDELAGNGVGGVMVGDGFLIVALILAATDTAFSSLLWLLLLIPAFFYFGKGFTDLVHSNQIRRRQKEAELLATRSASLNGLLNVRGSGELLSAPSVTERTTRQLH